MRLRVLGMRASYPGPDGVCSGYLVDDGVTALLFDCGHGVVGRLASVMDPADLDAVFITHGHPDHVADLFALMARLRYAPDGPAPALPLYGPHRLLESLSCMLSERGTRELLAAFEHRPLHAGQQVRVGGLAVEAAAVTHSDEAFGFRVLSDTGSLFYTGDAALTEELPREAAGCGLILCEATLPQGAGSGAEHMTPAQAATLAREAGAEALLLTHLWPGVPGRAILDQAEEVFGGLTLLARDGLVIAAEGGSWSEKAEGQRTS